MLYSSWMPKKKLDERLKMPMSQLVETVSRKAIPEHVRDIVCEIMVNDDTDEDVEVPYLKIRIR